MDFELELGELRPLFGGDEGFKDISSCNHILHNGEIYNGSYDQQIGGLYWRCITDPEMDSIHHYNWDPKNPFMVQVITYKRTKEKVVPVPEPDLLTDMFGNFEVITRHVNHPIIGKKQICRSEICDCSSETICFKLETFGISIHKAHEQAIIFLELQEKI